MNRHPFNRLWFQFSAVIVGIVIMVAATIIGATYFMLPLPLAQRIEGGAQRTIFADWLPRMLTRDALLLVVSSGILAIGGGVLMSRRMTAPLVELAEGAAMIGTGDFSRRVSPTGSAELVALATSFNRMAANLEDAEQLRRNLLADVAHELRSPLTVLQGNLRALLDDVYPLDKAEVARLYDQTRHLNRLVNDLHVLAQAEARQLPLHLEATDVNRLVKATAESFESLFELEQVELDLDLPVAPPVVCADRARMTQALQNLLTNALRHTPPGGRITIRIERTGAYMHLIVNDNGDGIEAEHLPFVFNRFYRADRTRERDAGGAGLGLALVRAITEAHGGHASAESPGRGQGSTFTLRLPISTVDKSLLTNRIDVDIITTKLVVIEWRWLMSESLFQTRPQCNGAGL